MMASRSPSLGTLPKKPGASTASSTRRRLLRMRARRGAVPMMAAISSMRLGLLLEQREELHAGGQLGEEAVEADEGEVGVGRGRQRLDQQRLHLGQQLAGARARARPDSGRGARRARPAITSAGRAKPMLGERLERAGIVGLAGKDHVGAPAGQLRAVLEEAHVVRLHALQLGGEAGGERRRIGKAAEAGERGELVGVVRQPSASARRRSSAADARPCAGSGTPRRGRPSRRRRSSRRRRAAPAQRASRARAAPAGARRRSAAGSGRRTRSRGCRRARP